MADYNLFGLNTRTFEQLIQGLSDNVLGAGLVIFGDGPDGGREATFEGKVPYPSDVANWNGYIVLQAKFKQKSSANDVRWVLKEIEKELKKFSSKKRRLRCPDYYIFSTNISISGVHKSGGKDRVAALFEKYKTVLPIREYSLWDYDKIRVYLDKYENIRRTYCAWITTGDVLTEVFNYFQSESNDFSEVINSYLAKQLLDDQYVNLEQAGHNTDEKTALAKVFFDLPIRPDYKLIKFFNGEEYFSTYLNKFTKQKNEFIDIQETIGVINYLLFLGTQQLKANLYKSFQKKKATSEDGGIISEPGRVVLVGGPGQGKSTISQFICQIHRVALLKDHHYGQHTECQYVISQILEQCNEENIPLPSARRYPFRIDLNRFASKLSEISNGNIGSLIGYMCILISTRLDRKIKTNDLRRWLKEYPWLIVLDGLDEVPATSNRADVLRAISDFRVDVSQLNADILIVTTTRPQGYSEDFSPEYFQHFNLLELDKTKALHYARRLAESRYKGEFDRIDKIIERLTQASGTAATEKLMRSPLQVTIMTTLVDKIGVPPKQRWELFNAYYDVIFQRERERKIPAADLLRNNRTDIDIIHQRTGLALQVESETLGRTDALLTSDEFLNILKCRLKEEGHSEDDVSSLSEKILNAALERLVFLVAPVSESAGFEVRSLQEFMAAECLMDGSDESVIKRLNIISSVAHWRNVFLFAAGKCLLKRQHLRDNVYAICGSLNEHGDTYAGETLERSLLAGSMLALDVLDDESASSSPAQLKSYARLSLRICDLPPFEAHEKLANQFVSLLQSVYMEEIERRLNYVDFNKTLGAWLVLLFLVKREIDWAIIMADKYWPVDIKRVEQIFRIFRAFDIYSEWILAKRIEFIPKLSPSSIIITEMFYSSRRNINDHYAYANREFPAWMKGLTGLSFRVNYQVHLKLISNLRCQIGIVQFLYFENILKDALDIPSQNKQWDWLKDVVDFIFSPNEVKLAKLLERLASFDSEDIRELKNTYCNRTPWPLASCLNYCSTSAELVELSDRVKDGKIGNADIWIRAEERWRKTGININDLLVDAPNDTPFNSDIDKTGLPYYASTGMIYEDYEPTHDKFIELFDIKSKLSTPGQRKWIDNFIIEYVEQLFYENASFKFGKDVWLKILDLNRNYLDINFLYKLPDEWYDDYEYVSRLNAISTKQDYIQAVAIHRNIGEGVDSVSSIVDSVGSSIEKAINNYGRMPGLIKLLLSVFCTGYSPKHIITLGEPSDHVEQDLKLTSILLQLVNESEIKFDLEEYSRYLADTIKNNTWVLAVLFNIIQNHIIKSSNGERFLCLLYKKMETDSSVKRRSLMNALTKLQARHKSALRQEWNACNLPESIIT